MLISEEKILNARILAVDDNPVNVALLRDMLEAAGFSGVVAMTDPAQALELLARESFDLLLLDIRMPGMDGHEVMQRLPAVLRGAYLPVVVLTAQTDTETRLKALSGGARDFITKPFDMTEVIQRIRNALEAQLLYAERRDQAAALEQEVALRTAELAFRASHDIITELPNRSGIRHALARRLAETCLPSGNAGVENPDAEAGDETAGEAPCHSCGAVLFVSVEGLEAVNDSLGHTVGEQVLRAIGERLCEVFPAPALVGCWGGTEFLLITADARADLWADVAQSVFAMPFQVAGNELVLECTVGSALFPRDGEEGDLLVRRAGMAMFFARQRGIHHCPFTNDLEEAAYRRHELERELRGAIERNELQVYYQPKVALEDGSVVGMEALLRWFHPVMGFVSPAQFIPVAEETGAIVHIGEWVMQQACRDTAGWRSLGYPDLMVAVNVSGRQFETPDLPGTIFHALAEAGLPARNLEVEITETALMRDLDRARRVLSALRSAGVHLAIDDFGTGYSSLAYLRNLAIDTLKVDQSFVRDLGEDPDDQAIVRTIVAMAHSLGLNTVAEGIEEEFHVTFLRNLGCEMGQGYFYARPMPAADFEAFLLKTPQVAVSQ